MHHLPRNPNIPLHFTLGLGLVKKINPLKITYLRNLCCSYGFSIFNLTESKQKVFEKTCLSKCSPWKALQGVSVSSKFRIFFIYFLQISWNLQCMYNRTKGSVNHERSNCNSNPLRVFIRPLSSICGQSFIEIGGGHLDVPS